MDSNTSTAVAVPQRKRRRPALACEQCRRRKVKCDRSSPCDQCTKTKSDICTYVPDDRTSPRVGMRRVGISHPLGSRSASPLGGGESPTYTEMLSTITAFDPRVNQVPNSGISTVYTESPSRERGGDSTFSLEQSLMDRVKSLEQRLSDASSSRSSEPTVLSPVTTQDSRPSTTPSLKGVFSKTRFFGQSHWMNNAQQVSHTSHVQQKNKKYISIRSLGCDLLVYQSYHSYVTERALFHQDMGLIQGLVRYDRQLVA